MEKTLCGASLPPPFPAGARFSHGQALKTVTVARDVAKAEELPDPGRSAQDLAVRARPSQVLCGGRLKRKAVEKNFYVRSAQRIFLFTNQTAWRRKSKQRLFSCFLHFFWGVYFFYFTFIFILFSLLYLVFLFKYTFFSFYHLFVFCF